eukprot:scaffold72048_cov56-Phaeocystis_antarctica.AAC.1
MLACSPHANKSSAAVSSTGCLPSPRVCHVCAAAGPTPSAFRPTPRSASYAFLSTRQAALAFNQPLSLDR